MEPIILASASPRRRELLTQIGIPFEVRPSEIDESKVALEGHAWQKAEKLACIKALDIAEKAGSGLILGADTIVVVDDCIFGKPKDENDAFKMLSKLKGREHFVITGIAVADSCNAEVKTSHEITKVVFSDLGEDEIKAYINSGEPFGKAGAYAIQGIGSLLVEKIEGCYFNVVGLPLARLKKLLEEFGVNILRNG